VVSGGELTLDMLDLRLNPASKMYEAPFQLKANNGIYLVDDFGRQRATPAEVLNRWIAPMERHKDYLTFATGGKMMVPFETFLVFSTNSNPSELGDEAFMRRIQYKMLLRGPAENEFIRIFESFCAARKLPYPAGLAAQFVEKYYRRTAKPLRRCHPRDVLSHVLNLIHFEKLPFALTEELLDRAFQSCFVQEGEAGSAPESAILPSVVPSCADHWGDKLAHIPTAFGTLAFIASFRTVPTDRYVEAESAREYGDAQTSRVLARLHTQSFREWLGLNREQQSRDLALYLASEGGAAKLRQTPEVVRQLVPDDAKEAETQIFSGDLQMLLESLAPSGTKPAAKETAEEEWQGPELNQRIA
jgi:hypothetical protein